MGGMQEPFLKRAATIVYFAVLENPSKARPFPIISLSTSVPPSFAGMIDRYLTREVGERMGEGCSDLLKDKRGLSSLV